MISIVARRIFRALKLEGALFEEIKMDKGAMGQAALVVALSAAAAGLGNFESGGFIGIFRDLVLAFGGWVISGYIIYLIGTKVLPVEDTNADYASVLRTIGFAKSPGILGGLAFIPGLEEELFLVCLLWMLVAQVVAVKHVMSYERTFRAVMVTLLGLVVQLLLFQLVLSFLGVSISPPPSP